MNTMCDITKEKALAAIEVGQNLSDSAVRVLIDRTRHMSDVERALVWEGFVHSLGGALLAVFGDDAMEVIDHMKVDIYKLMEGNYGHA